jgi:hypothetical protein
MRTQFSKIALAAGFLLALALTFSCSTDGGGSSKETFWYSGYGLTTDSYTYILNLHNQYENQSYDDVKYEWSEIKRLGTWIESYNGVSEQEIKDFLVQRDVSPNEAERYLTLLKKRGNIIQAFNSSDYRYHSIMIYVERE